MTHTFFKKLVNIFSGRAGCLGYPENDIGENGMETIREPFSIFFSGCKQPNLSTIAAQR
jgi:hypothetical protein